MNTCKLDITTCIKLKMPLNYKIYFYIKFKFAFIRWPLLNNKSHNKLNSLYTDN